MTRVNSKKACLLLALGALIAGSAAAGVAYKSETKMTREGKRKEEITRVQGWADGAKARVSIEESDNEMFGEGNYLVSPGTGDVFLVNPQEKTYMRFDPAAALGVLGALGESEGGFMNFDISDVTTAKVLEEPGEAILGHDTTHYRFQTGYTMTLKVMGMGRRDRVETTVDSWNAAALSDAGLGIWLRERRPKTGDEDFDKLIDSSMTDVEGFPLKSVSVVTTTSKKGKKSTATYTTLVTDLATETIDPGMFVIPADFQEITLSQTEQQGDGLGLSGLFGKKKKDG